MTEKKVSGRKKASGRKKMFPVRLRDDDRENLEVVRRKFNLKTLADAFRFSVRVVTVLAKVDEETAEMLKDAHDHYETENPDSWKVTEDISKDAGSPSPDEAFDEVAA